MDLGQLYNGLSYDDLKWLVPVLGGLALIVGGLFIGIVRGMTAGLLMTLFFGGPLGPTFGLENVDGWVGGLLPGLLGFVWFMAKTAVFIFLFILLRGALPRMKYRELMLLGWKVMIPFGLVWAMLTALIVVVRDQVDNGGFVALVIGLLSVGATFLVVNRVMRSQRRQRGLPSVEDEPLEPVVAEQRALAEQLAAAGATTGDGTTDETGPEDGR